MYQSYFQFDARPFPAPPQADFYVPTESWEETLRTVARVIERAEGPALVVGGVGTGKSLLCHLLAAHYQKVFQVAMLSSARLCTSRALLQNLLFELNLPYRDRSEGELRFALMEALEPGPENEHGLLLIVDEAQGLSRRLLEEIRMLTNLVRGGQARVRLVLAGTTRLEEQFAHPRMESFNQRLACRCYMESLTGEETATYIQTQLQSVNSGQRVEIFDEQAIAAVHKLTDGVPRLINQLCDHALLAAAAQQATMIDQRIVEMAWADLQQLPAPFTAEESVAPTSNVIEFGQLDDIAVEPALSSVEQSEPISEVIEIVPLEEAIGETGEPIAVEEDPAEVMVPQLVEETEPPLEALLPLESGDPVAGQDSAVQEEFSPRTTSSSQSSSEVGREWTVVAPLEDETPVVAGKEDEVSLIIRRDEEHQIGADHQQVSAEALERQRQLLDRFRQS
jgi:general secretion pathway protein A